MSKTSQAAIDVAPMIGELVEQLSLTDRLRVFGSAHALCGDDPEIVAIGQMEQFLVGADHDARLRVLRWAISFANERGTRGIIQPAPTPRFTARSSITPARSPKHCSICKRTGHDKRSCTRKPKKKYGADAVELPESAP